jgi:atypical dual specificity phosphatase
MARLPFSVGNRVSLDVLRGLFYLADMADFYDPFSSVTGNAGHARERRPDLSEILPSLFVGEYPRTEDIAWLKYEFGISAVLSLQDDEDLAVNNLSLPDLRSAYHQHGVAFCRAPVTDFNCQSLAETLPQALTELQTFVQGGDVVFLHCNAGCNRAPTLAIAYLHVHHGLGLGEARDFVKARRACGPYMEVLRAWSGELGAKKRTRNEESV